MKFHCLLAAALAAVVAVPSSHAQTAEDFSSLEERMTGEEFTAAGLDKLSPGELAALNQWIRERSLATREAPAGGMSDRPGTVPAPDQMAREPFRCPLVGTFSGWTGQTVFELENGMVWRQAESDRYRVQPEENAVVVIRPGFGGSWRLSVEGHNRAIRVERVE